METNTTAAVCPESTDQSEWNDAKDGELMAALIAIDTKQAAKRESDKKRATEERRSRVLQSKAKQFRTPQAMRKYFQGRHPGFAEPASSRRTGTQSP
jgi:hypothetical protein